ncbi:N-acetylmuramoyl-L-alanine amidase [Zavarzinia sp.]|uniref:N-acetylmuramoyl-L-alanine amidase n=1 Tax=Zavarzinia sp. TaxID=2027920 RepID=UPI003568CD7A
MMYIDKHHLMQDGHNVDFLPTPNMGGTITPQYLVLHYTAGGSAAGAVSWLTSAQSKASAHLVIGRDGKITQLVPFNRCAWHAGKSRWNGFDNLNELSIGIELVNAGMLTLKNGDWRTPSQTLVADDDVVVAVHKNDTVERGWQKYPEAQVLACAAVARALFAEYPLSEIIGHDDIAPFRKIDPGPAWPMDEFRTLIFGKR